MQQVLFNEPFFGLPIYGYGMMLFLAYFFCNWMASWLAKKEGIPPHTVYDLGIWLFVCGIAGARLMFMIQFGVPFTLWNFIALWDGGLIFYGSAIGGVVGYLGAYYFILRKHKISSWKMADVLAPCIALGLCLGRIGCLLNGCCYGNVACPDCAAVSFPLPTYPRFAMVEKGYQTAAGFTLSDEVKARVWQVEPGSPAAQAGLRGGDDILEIERDGEMKQVDVFTFLGDHRSWPRGQNELTMKVRHSNGQEEKIGPYVPWTIGLHPTQIYESISTALLALFLLAYFPYRRRDGELMVLLMLGYAVHRFLNEILRIDTDPVAFGMTLSQNMSVAVFLSGIAFGIWIWLRGKPPQDVAAAFSLRTDPSAG